jgi:hypothetical protein
MSEKLPAHASQEMAMLIVEVENAKKVDAESAEKWVRDRAKAKLVWDAKPENVRKHLISEGMGWSDNAKPPTGSSVRAIRRKIRYKIFRLREGKWQTDKELAALKSWYEMQFQGGWSWKDFTFKWDVSAKDPLKIITQIEWDGDVVSEKTGSGSLGKFCDPAAFTNQEM